MAGLPLQMESAPVAEKAPWETSCERPWGPWEEAGWPLGRHGTPRKGHTPEAAAWGGGGCRESMGETRRSVGRGCSDTVQRWHPSACRGYEHEPWETQVRSLPRSAGLIIS